MLPWQTTLEPWSVHQTITAFITFFCFSGYGSAIIGPRRRASTPAKEQGYKLHGGQQHNECECQPDAKAKVDVESEVTYFYTSDVINIIKFVLKC